VSLDDVRTLHLVETTEDAMDCLRWLSNKPKIGFDTEGTGLKPERDRVRLVQIGDREEGWAIPYELNQMLVEDIVKRFEGSYLMFNAPYDVAMMRSSGIQMPIERVEDVRLKAHVLSSTGPLALKKLCAMHVDPAAANLQDDLAAVFAKHHWSWATIPWNFKAYWMYGALDPVLTYQLDEIVSPLVQESAPASYDLEMAAAWPVERMMRNGAAVDRPYVTTYLSELTQRAEKLLMTATTDYGVRPGSGTQVADALIKDGVDLWRRTKSGLFQMDKVVLGEVISKYDHPLAKIVLEYRQITKMTGTYLETYLDLSEQDGRIHPSINTVGGVAKNPFENGGDQGVRTGRMSGSDPNLQNVPMRTAEGKKIRKSFVPQCTERCGCGEPHAWIKCDFDQIEQRVMAHMCGDQGMREAFLSPVDFFVSMGQTMFTEPDFQKSDPRRQLIKNAAYANIYGAGPDKFAVTAGLFDEQGEPDIDRARAFMLSMNDAFPGPQNFSRRVIREANVRYRNEGEAYVRSPLTGRKLVADRGKFYALVNYLIQGMAGELLKMKIVEADAAGLSPYMVLAVHDEIDLDVPVSQVDDVIGVLGDIFNDHKVLKVPVTAGIEVGPSWGAVDDVEKFDPKNYRESA
jgi:DNA polymerase-1